MLDMDKGVMLDDMMRKEVIKGQRHDIMGSQFSGGGVTVRE